MGLGKEESSSDCDPAGTEAGAGDLLPASGEGLACPVVLEHGVHAEEECVRKVAVVPLRNNRQMKVTFTVKDSTPSPIIPASGDIDSSVKLSDADIDYDVKLDSDMPTDQEHVKSRSCCYTCCCLVSPRENSSCYGCSCCQGSGEPWATTKWNNSRAKRSMYRCCRHALKHNKVFLWLFFVLFGILVAGAVIIGLIYSLTVRNNDANS